MFKLGGTDPEKSYRATLNNDDGDSNETQQKAKKNRSKKQLSVSTSLASRLRNETA